MRTRRRQTGTVIHQPHLFDGAATNVTKIGTTDKNGQRTQGRVGCRRHWMTPSKTPHLRFASLKLIDSSDSTPAGSRSRRQCTWMLNGARTRMALASSGRVYPCESVKVPP